MNDNSDPTSPPNHRRQGRPPRYDDPRGTIRSAALKLFGERGFEATSVADIAEAAGVPKANVLYYFPSKDALWKEAVDTLWSEVDAFFESNLPQPLAVSPEGLGVFLRVFLAACSKFPSYVMIPNVESSNDSWRAHWLGEKHLRRHMNLASNYCRALIDANVVPEIDTIVFQNIIAGGAQLLVGQERLWRIALEREDGPIDFTESYIDGILTLIRGAKGQS